MSSRSRVRTVSLEWRRIGAALPAVVLVGSGMTLAAFGQAPAHHGTSRAMTSSGSPVVTVPRAAVRAPATPLAGGQPVAPALELPAGYRAGSAQRVTLDAPGIPTPALAAYHRAADLVSAADPACHIDWALPAAIGRVESDHGRFGGNSLDAAGIARPGIYGVALDGTRGTARVPDTDHGTLDRDPVWDRAVGPMQFIPGTWRVVGSDADGDGARNPQDMADAATATAVYLCAGPGDLAQPGDLYAAVLRYNHSDAYARTVIAIADAYRRGVTALPASALPAAAPARTGGQPPAPAAAARRATASPSAAGTPARRPTGPTSSPAPGGPPAPAPAPTGSSQPTGLAAVVKRVTGPLTPSSTTSSASASPSPQGTATAPPVCVIALGVKVCTPRAAG